MRVGLKRVAPWILLVVLNLLASARGATIQLSLVVDEQSHIWDAYLAITDPANQTLGLAGIQFSVLGGDGISVVHSFNQLPQSTESTDLATFFQKGFIQLRSDGSGGVGIRAAQGLFNTLSPTGTGKNNVLEGVGKQAFIETNGVLAATHIDWPALIACGTYTGDAGFLTIVGSPELTTLLPAALPANDSPISTFSPTAVVGQTITLVPEPGTLILAVAGLIALIVGRRYC